MAKPKMDYSKVYIDDSGQYKYREGARNSWRDATLSKYQRQQFLRWSDIKSSRTSSVGANKKYFSSGTSFTQRTGHLHNWAKPMSLRGGDNPNHNWNRAKYVSRTGIKTVGAKHRWGADVNRYKKGAAGKYATFNGSQWIRHLQIALYQLHIQAENYRVMVGKRALKVFQTSFREKKFYSNKGRRWQSLAPYTLKKRASRGTGFRILHEYGDLLNSIKVDERVGYNKTRVYTDIVPANASHHKKHSICYAGYHNEGKGRYGAPRNGHTPKPYVKRKFMGHSSHLNPLTDAWLRKMMKQYLFDSVFQVKK